MTPRPRDRTTFDEIRHNLRTLSQEIDMPGVAAEDALDTFTLQLIESIRRVQFVRTIGERPLSDQRINPTSALYDPLKAAHLLGSRGQHDEACWQVFLFAVFGKHVERGWDLARDFYGSLDGNTRWSWARVTEDIGFFTEWYRQNSVVFIQRGHRFGNHRKYESLRADARRNIPRIVASYVSLITELGGHTDFFLDAFERANKDPKQAFGCLYQRLRRLISFGRTTTFDYLCALSNLDLTGAVPDKAYIEESNGPLRGARLLLGADVPTRGIDSTFLSICDRLSIGLQEMEDALCNWQKSPSYFVPFRG